MHSFLFKREQFTFQCLISVFIKNLFFRGGTVLVYGGNSKERFRITRHNDVVNAITYNHNGNILLLFVHHLVP